MGIDVTLDITRKDAIEVILDNLKNANDQDLEVILYHLLGKNCLIILK